MCLLMLFVGDDSGNDEFRGERGEREDVGSSSTAAAEKGCEGNCGW